MKRIELVKGISSSVLGFGCAPVLGAVDAQTARRAIDCALDNEINHFDLARSYGYGEAEHFVGKMLKGKRHDVVITSKFGITANWKARLLRPAKPILRAVLNMVKKQKPGIAQVKNKNIAGSLHNHLPINAKAMRLSLEKSLKALNTDYLDYFLLHEPLETIADIDELAAAAQMLQQEGKIRAWGLSFMQTQQPLHNSYLDRFDLLQFNRPQTESEYRRVYTERGQSSNIIFSPFGLSGLKADVALRSLSGDFQRSVILCSMFNEQHIIENAAVFR